MPVKYTPEVKQILKAAGYSDAEIKTLEVKAEQAFRVDRALKPEDLKPMNPEKYSDEALQPLSE
jgi:hypothetical protein